jgi:uncharacterized protein (DUF58 family)
LIGLIYCSMMMFIGLAAMNSQNNLLFAVFGLMIGVLITAFFASRWVLRGVEIVRHLPSSAQVGRSVRIEYSVRNKKRFWPTFSLALAELDLGPPGESFDRQPHAYVLHAASGVTARVGAEVVPLRRGWQSPERLQLSTGFPFGFVRRSSISRLPDRILIGPARGAVDPKAMLRFLSARSSGLNQRPREGGRDELFGVREYRPGDPIKSVHWRRSARTLALASSDRPKGTLTVKQMTRVAPPRLVMMVDTYAADTGDDVEARLSLVEKNLATAASLIAAATSRGLSVGLTIWREAASESQQAWLEVRPGRGKRHRRELLVALAEASRNVHADVHALLQRGMVMATGDTTAVLITAGTDEPLQPEDRPPEPVRARASRNVRRPGRGNVVVVATASPDIDRWVAFDDKLDWRSMIPLWPTGDRPAG